ncbi:hypothetical protein BDC45DRAFT_571186 [Circinella umbellata]|nr:hypothetical protein BDC45DRAFT_571186 [Circinella umbellata]
MLNAINGIPFDDSNNEDDDAVEGRGNGDEIEHAQAQGDFYSSESEGEEQTGNDDLAIKNPIAQT